MATKPKQKALDDKSQIGIRLKQARETLGLTQQQVADKIGISRSAVVHYEQGNVFPGGSELIGLAKALKTTPNFILSGKESFYASTDPRHTLAINDFKDEIQVARLAMCMQALDREEAETVSALILTLIKAKLSKKDFGDFLKAMDIITTAMSEFTPEVMTMLTKLERDGAFDHLDQKGRRPKKS